MRTGQILYHLLNHDPDSFNYIMIIKKTILIILYYNAERVPEARLDISQPRLLILLYKIGHLFKSNFYRLPA